MKIFNKFLYLVAALSLTVVACEEPTPFEPGPQEEDGCYGVYFPAQEASGSHILSPTDALEFTIKLSRNVTDGAITVPVISEFSEDDIFTVTAAEFADGQGETTFKVSFPGIQQGKTYSASFRIDDNKYASIYSSNAAGLDLSFMQVEMKDFKTEDGSANAALTFTDNVFWGEVHDDVYLKYYEVDGVRYCETTGGKLVSDGGTDGEGPFGTDVQMKFKWYLKNTVEIDGVECQFIEVEPQYHGWDYQGATPVYFGDRYNQLKAMGSSSTNGLTAYEWFMTKGDQLPCYYDGHGGFYFNMSYWLYGTTSWFGFQNDAPIAIADGYLRVDYTLEVESDFSDGGVSPIYITAGPDVASVKYQVYEGSLNAAQINNKIEEIAEDATAVTITDELVLDEDDNMKYATLGITPEKSGTYTFVALALDASGKVQNSGSVSFKCITAEDEPDHAVDIYVFTEDTPERYQTLHDYDSFAYCISGSGLSEVHVGVFNDATLTKYGADFLLYTVKSDSSYSVSEEELEKIQQDGGLYDVVTKLAAKTTYYIIVWATNGDLEKIVYSAYTTNKLPYVWVSLGQGEITDGFYNYLFNGKTDYTGPCDVYEEKNTPGLYMITGFQCADVAHFFNMEPEDMLPYEGGNWKNTEVVVDATDPTAVFIEEQDWGICVNSSYGFFQIETEDSGTLVDGVISWPAEEMYVGLPGLGKWYYANDEGTFKIVLPSAVSSGAPALAPAKTEGFGMIVDEEIIRSARVSKNVVKATFERDAKPAQNVNATVTGGRRTNFNRTVSEVR